MQTMNQGLRCPECSTLLVALSKEAMTPITRLEAICKNCVKIVKYNSGSIKADELQRLPSGQMSFEEATESEAPTNETVKETRSTGKRKKALPAT